MLAYCAMLLFDFSVMAGTVYLIEWRGWSVWCLLLAFILVQASNPKIFLE